ncbi:Uncharacterised protein [Mycobacterium tuberculosis]|nr:Uncharacterised protein [Mycobacterium tuberculosis]CFS19770.1 Uncharacterised protein [Mycobacterium tuberculosis]CKP69037.1 Uncharacterised protein [Mycobacterium tuberculosis]CNM57109.1 Uncharacterised protein [Mycobacterium tuberculosis]CNV60048.1 Uncharacterised protein [Mycobacterium tuberculosis]
MSSPMSGSTSVRSAVGLAVVTPSVYSGSACSLQAVTTAWISSSET